MTTKMEIADVLYSHQWDNVECDCGWRDVESDDHVDHQAEALMGKFDIKPKSNPNRFHSA